MKIRTDPHSVVTDAIAMSVSTMEHVKAVSPVDRTYLTAALTSCAEGTEHSIDETVMGILSFTQSVLSTPANDRSVSRIVMLMSAGNVIPDMSDPLTQFLDTLTDLPLDGGTAPWANLRGHLDDEFMSRFTVEWWELASNMLDALYLDVLYHTKETVSPFSLLLIGALPPIMSVLFADSDPAFASFPGELLLTMYGPAVAKELIQAMPYLPQPLRDWAEIARASSETDN